MPGKRPPFTPSSILFRPRRNPACGRALVEAPGTAPGSERLIAMTVYRHSRREPTREYRGIAAQKKGRNRRRRLFRRSIACLSHVEIARQDGDAMAASRKETDTFGPIEVPAERYWGAQTQRSIQNFRIGDERMPRPLVHALGLVKQAAARANRSLGELDAGSRRSDRGRRRRGRGRQARRRVSAGRLADRLGHAVQHECQRGDLEPRHRGARRRASARRSRSIPTITSIAASPPTTPFRPPCTSRRRVEIKHRLLPALEPPAQGAGRQGQGLCRPRQDRPHPSAGRDAAHARPGILRLCRAGRARHPARARAGSTS